MECSDPDDVYEMWRKYNLVISGSNQIWNKHSNELDYVDWKYMNPYLSHDYYNKKGGNNYYKSLRTVIYRLNDILDDVWNEVHSDKGKHFELSVELIEIVDKYCCWAKETGHAPRTIKNKRYAISWFLSELLKMGCSFLKQLSPALIMSACSKITEHNLWGEIRTFFKYLSEFEIIIPDYSTIVPHYSKPYVIPSVYSIEEIKRIEEAVDTTTVLGKRDYAMLLLASRMGMRSGDIVNLRIEDVSKKMN